MKIVVKKFGGTSLGDISRIKDVARLIANFHQNNPGCGIVVVASAMAGETNRLQNLAGLISPAPVLREMDLILGTGEVVSSSLLAIALNDLNIPSSAVSGSKTGIKTDGRHRDASIEKVKPVHILELLGQGIVPVVTGFQGTGPTGELTTLGRGGSDTSAISLAAALKAECYIYTDVEGVFSANPNVCQNAQRLESLSSECMYELARLGAKVVNTEAARLAFEQQCDYRVLSTFNPCVSTRILAAKSSDTKGSAVAVASSASQALISLTGLEDLSEELLLSARSLLAQEGIRSDYLNQKVNQHPPTFMVKDDLAQQAQQILQEFCSANNGKGALLDRNISLVSVVGPKIGENLNLISQIDDISTKLARGSSRITSNHNSVSLIIPRKVEAPIVKAIHNALIISPGSSQKATEPLRGNSSNSVNRLESRS